MKHNALFSMVLAGSAFLNLPLPADHLWVMTPQGEWVATEVSPDLPLSKVWQHLCTMEEVSQETPSFFQVLLTPPAAMLSTRDYQRRTSREEKKDITYIVKTLAYDSLVQVGCAKASLKEAGKRIQSVHPFQFLIVVFQDDELKVGFDIIRNRTWIGKKFFSGLKESLEEESGRDNLLPFLDDFAKKIGLSPSRLRPLIQAKKWDSVIKLLIEQIPPRTDADRYNL